MPDAFSMNSAEEGTSACDLARRDGLAVGGIETRDVGVERFHQLGVRDAETAGVYNPVATITALGKAAVPVTLARPLSEKAGRGLALLLDP
jgi:hypothetical protein